MWDFGLILLRFSIVKITRMVLFWNLCKVRTILLDLFFQQAKLPVQLCVAKYYAFLRCSVAVSHLSNIVNSSNTWMEVEIKLNQCTDTALILLLFILLWIDDNIAIRKLSVNENNINIKACLINISKTSNFNSSYYEKWKAEVLP